MALAVCLLFDARTENALRNLWERLEEAGVPSMASHTHGWHVPHLSYAVLRSWELGLVKEALEALPDGGPLALHLDAVGTFRRGRSWLAPAVSSELVRRQERVTETLARVPGADLHKHYTSGVWLPHCTIAPRVRLAELPVVTAIANDVLPLSGVADRAALVDSGTGERWSLGNIP